MFDLKDKKNYFLNNLKTNPMNQIILEHKDQYKFYNLVAETISKLNKDGKVNVMVKSGLFEEEYDILSYYPNASKGVTSIVSKDNYYFVVNIKEVKEAGDKDFQDCKGKVISDYQQFLESNWVNELRKEFEVKVNQDVFNKVKQQLNQ